LINLGFSPSNHSKYFPSSLLKHFPTKSQKESKLHRRNFVNILFNNFSYTSVAPSFAFSLYIFVCR
jgi:hypothetical protein